MRRSLRAAALFAVIAALLPLLPGGSSPVGAQPPRAANFATAGQLADWAYRSLLGREIDRSAAAFWRVALDSPSADPSVLLDNLADSAEFQAWTGQIIRAYRTAYGRGADVGGLRFWLSQRGPVGGASFFERLGASFLAGPEYQAIYGSVSDREFVRRLYVNALGREPDAAGSNFWTSLVGTAGRPAVLALVSESAEHRARRAAEVQITAAYALLLGRVQDPAGGAYWQGRLTTGTDNRALLASIFGSAELTARLGTVPSIQRTDLVEGLSVPWGLAFAPDGTMLFTQRPGPISVRLTDGTVRTITADLSDLRVSGEGGLLDLALDPNFASNRRFYVCMNRESPRDVAVVAWTMNPGYTAATRVGVVLGGMPTTTGRHSGCRILPDPTTPGVLLVATGDAAIGTEPQNLDTLGGKLLRIDSTTGNGVVLNPFFQPILPATNRSRIHGYGHRNLQGLAIRPGSNQIWTAEHGSDRDDELNIAVSGGNYGWNPVGTGTYDESVPMTDLAEFPNAVQAAWSSGFPTVATSGITFLDGCQWGSWNGALAVALLKGSELRLHFFTQAGVDLGFVVVAELDQVRGRLRTPRQGPDGALYVTTGNVTNDRIVRIAPSGGRCFSS